MKFVPSHKTHRARWSPFP